MKVMSRELDWINEQLHADSTVDSAFRKILAGEKDEKAVVPVEIDRAKHRHVLAVWNECMEECASLEMTWPRLVAAFRKVSE